DWPPAAARRFPCAWRCSLPFGAFGAGAGKCFGNGVALLCFFHAVAASPRTAFPVQPQLPGLETVACQGGAVTVDAAGGRPDGLASVGGGFGHVDAVDRTHRYAEFAAGALVGNDGVHLLGRADDGIGRADLDAARAA